MINIPEVLSGRVTFEAIRILMDMVEAKVDVDPRVNQLCIFPGTVRATQFYGAQIELPRIALVGRWQVVEMFGGEVILPCTLEGQDVIDFEETVGTTITKMENLAHFVSNPEEPISYPVHSTGFESVGALAGDLFGGLLVKVGARPYDPFIHGSGESQTIH